MNNGLWIIRFLTLGERYYDASDRKVLHNDLIPPHVCKRLITHCLEQNIQLQIYNGMIVESHKDDRTNHRVCKECRCNSRSNYFAWKKLDVEIWNWKVLWQLLDLSESSRIYRRDICRKSIMLSSEPGLR